MKPFALRSALQVLLPAALLLASCSKKDEPTLAPAPDQGRIDFYHAAASANVSVKVVVDATEKGNITYGQKTGYQAFNVGSRSVVVNVASSGTQAFPPQSVVVEKDKNYSYFAYSPSAITVAGVFVPDNLNAPGTGMAKPGR